jgi:coproporphyrinogen III oxidase
MSGANLLLGADKLNAVEAWVLSLQDSICAEFELLEQSEARFSWQSWQRDESGGDSLGGGLIRLMRGTVFEKVGVNTSTVFGPITEQMRATIPALDGSTRFWACGISLVAHMMSPFVPAVHMNTRIFCSDRTYWFGGGADLTPTFPDAEDTATFHDALREACESYRAGSYAKFKDECDKYFFLKHRNEQRGVGGIFYDYLRSPSFDDDFAFMRAVGSNFLSSYRTIVARNMGRPWSQEEKKAQLFKRGRYVEFNLLYDRGTKFGLVTGANPEAVLMSLPPQACW